MKEITVNHYHTFPDNSTNPARCNRATATIDINDKVWSKLTPLQQDWWMAHERGHIILNTGDEIAADAYAFQQVAGSTPYSLIQIINAMRAVVPGWQNDRHRAIQIQALHYAARRGSTYASELLNKHTLMKKIPKKPSIIAFDSEEAVVPVRTTDNLPPFNPKLRPPKLQGQEVPVPPEPKPTAPIASEPPVPTVPINNPEPDIAPDDTLPQDPDGAFKLIVEASTTQTDVARANADATQGQYAISQETSKHNTRLIAGAAVVLVIVVLAVFCFKK